MASVMITSSIKPIERLAFVSSTAILAFAAVNSPTDNLGSVWGYCCDYSGGDTYLSPLAACKIMDLCEFVSSIKQSMEEHT